MRTQTLSRKILHPHAGKLNGRRKHKSKNFALSPAFQKKIERAYSHSLKSMKRKPYITAASAVVGLSLISGIVMLFRSFKE